MITSARTKLRKRNTKTSKRKCWRNVGRLFGSELKTCYSTAMCLECFLSDTLSSSLLRVGWKEGLYKVKPKFHWKRDKFEVKAAVTSAAFFGSSLFATKQFEFFLSCSTILEFLLLVVVVVVVVSINSTHFSLSMSLCHLFCYNYN